MYIHIIQQFFMFFTFFRFRDNTALSESQAVGLQMVCLSDYLYNRWQKQSLLKTLGLKFPSLSLRGLDLKQ